MANDINDYPEDITPKEQAVLERDQRHQEEIAKRNFQRAEREKQKQERQRRLEEKDKKKKPRPLLRYFNTDLLIPVNRTQIVPGNYYAFKYNNYKHSPIPLVFYIGSNPQYQTMEGINMQYLGMTERKRVEGYIQSLGLHTKHSAANGIKVRNVDGEDRHIYRNSYRSDSIYQFLKKKMRSKIYFYRRYKFAQINGLIYAVPIEAIDRALEIITPIRPFSRNEERKMKQSRSFFNKFVSAIKRFFGKQ